MLAQFVWAVLVRTATPPLYLRLIFKQMITIGYFSLPVVGLTAVFTGAALAQQIYVGSVRFNAEATVAGIVVSALMDSGQWLNVEVHAHKFQLIGDQLI